VADGPLGGEDLVVIPPLQQHDAGDG
jgi:hypothetical protein